MGHRHSKEKLGTSTSVPLDVAELVRTSDLCNEVFSNSVVTDCIFSLLPTKDILNFSSASKTWNLIAGSYLRNRRWLYFRIVLGDIKKLRKTLKVLQAGIPTSNHPFKGVTFYFSTDLIQLFCQPPNVAVKSKSDMDDLLERIIELIPLKHVAIRAPYPHQENFFAEILFPLLCDNEIETLSYDDLYSYQFRYLFRDVKSNGWSSLKVIQSWDSGFSNYELCAEDCEAVLRSCPNLQELISSWVGREEVLVFDKYNKLSLITCLKLHGSSVLEFENLFTSDKASLFRLEGLDIIYGDSDLQKQFHVLYKILQPSSNTLKRLRFTFSVADLEINDNIFKIMNLPPLTFAKQVEITFSGFQQDSYNKRQAANCGKHPKLLQIFPNAIEIDSKLLESELSLPSRELLLVAMAEFPPWSPHCT